jgi:hypothetical protein
MYIMYVYYVYILCMYIYYILCKIWLTSQNMSKYVKIWRHRFIKITKPWKRRLICQRASCWRALDCSSQLKLQRSISTEPSAAHLKRDKWETCWIGVHYMSCHVREKHDDHVMSRLSTVIFEYGHEMESTCTLKILKSTGVAPPMIKSSCVPIERNDKKERLNKWNMWNATEHRMISDADIHLILTCCHLMSHVPVDMYCTRIPLKNNNIYYILYSFPLISIEFS